MFENSFPEQRLKRERPSGHHELAQVATNRFAQPELPSLLHTLRFLRHVAHRRFPPHKHIDMPSRRGETLKFQQGRTRLVDTGF